MSVAEGSGIRTTPVAPILAGLAALAILAYLPALTQPFIQDDYSNIILAQHYGPASGWSTMLADPVFRLRSTSWILLYWLNRAFGVHPAPCYGVTILLHVLNTWLIYALGAWKPLDYRLSAWGAAFFAVYDKHQEAVMWISACPELLLLLFGLTGFLCWVRFLDGGEVGWYIAAWLALVAALFSKESAVILVALYTMPAWFQKRRRRAILFLAPMGAAAAAAAMSLFVSSSRSFRFEDGSFSLRAPVWLIWPENLAQVFWFWGAVGVGWILITKPAGYGRILAIGLAWAGLSLIPYSFLTYSLRIPSRQTYLASVGVALIAGLAVRDFAHKTSTGREWTGRRALVLAVCAIFVIQSTAYLWTKKRRQFLERAAPVEELIAMVRSTRGPVYVACFPTTRLQAESAVELMIPEKGPADLIWNAGEARRRASATFCYPSR